MLLLNYDFHDIHACIVRIRALPLAEENPAVVRVLREVIDGEQKDSVIEDNIIRRRLARLDPEDREKWAFAFVNNVYTAGCEIIKERRIYDFLSAALTELDGAVGAGNEKRIYDCADALHDLPLILTDRAGYSRRDVKREISGYCERWNPGFIDSVKLL